MSGRDCQETRLLYEAVICSPPDPVSVSCVVAESYHGDGVFGAVMSLCISPPPGVGYDLGSVYSSYCALAMGFEIFVAVPILGTGVSCAWVYLSLVCGPAIPFLYSVL